MKFRRIPNIRQTRRSLLTHAGVVAASGVLASIAPSPRLSSATKENIMAMPQTDALSDSAIRTLAERVVGEVIRPGDAGYDKARRVWNAAVDRYPELIVRPRQIDDVIQVVDFSRTNGLHLAIRGGGHSPAGYGTVDGGVVIDFSAMKHLDIDLEQRVAWAQPGLTWEEYNTRTQEHGLATPGGDVGNVGVAGLTLAGGMGWLMRKHGLTIDNLLSVEIITADGRLVTASPDEHPDLFWALRGGGGNFGVATGFRFRLQPVDQIVGGAIVYPASRDVLRAYASAIATSPDELTTITLVGKAPPAPFIPAEAHGSLIFMMLPCYTGESDAGRRALAPLQTLAGQTPLSDTTGPMSYLDLYNFTRMAAERRPHSIRNGYLRELTDDTIDSVIEFVERSTSPFTLVGLRELGGAVAHVPGEATAFAHRDKSFYLTLDNGWDDGLNREQQIAWLEESWQAIAPSTEGTYAGFMDDEGDDRVHAAYPSATYTRLAEVKRRYDPSNLFNVNPNIRPD